MILVSCSSNNEKISEDINQKNDLETEMIKAYNEGVEALNSGDPTYASKKFNEAEMLFPQSEWAPKASLMSAYAYWSQEYYSNSIGELERFIKLYSNNQNLDYAYYLLAMNYYESIEDEKKDIKPLLESKKHFQILIKKFPNQIINFNFSKSDFGMSDMNTHTVTDSKIQEASSYNLFTCLQKLYQKKKMNKMANCSNENLRNIYKEIFKRFIKPLYIPSLILISLLLIVRSKEDAQYNKMKYLIFLIGFLLIIFSESMLANPFSPGKRF